jgi:hypothetical protein
VNDTKSLEFTRTRVAEYDELLDLMSVHDVPGLSRLLAVRKKRGFLTGNNILSA